jgi:hypothetical protein
MTPEIRKKISDKLKGRKPWNAGLSGTKPIGLTFKGRKHSKESIEKTRNYFLGRPKTQEQKNKVSLFKKGSWTGEKNPQWKGGITSLVMQIRTCFQYRQWRSDVFTRDEFTCKHCGYKKGKSLNAHHVKSQSSIIAENNIKIFEDAIKCEELWNINNGITLCKQCHINLHKK